MQIANSGKNSAFVMGPILYTVALQATRKNMNYSTVWAVWATQGSNGIFLKLFQSIQHVRQINNNLVVRLL